MKMIHIYARSCPSWRLSVPVSWPCMTVMTVHDRAWPWKPARACTLVPRHFLYTLNWHASNIRSLIHQQISPAKQVSRQFPVTLLTPYLPSFRNGSLTSSSWHKNHQGFIWHETGTWLHIALLIIFPLGICALAVYIPFVWFASSLELVSSLNYNRT